VSDVGERDFLSLQSADRYQSAIRMKLSHLNIVAAVAERGSLRAAARQLNIAQPAITRSIREIESELGVALFERRPKGTVLTPMGELFLKRAISVLGELRRAREEIDQARGLMTGQVAIALSTAAQISLLPSALAAFRKKYPDVLISVRDGLFPAVEAKLKDGEFDFYVGPLPEFAPATDFVIEKLFDNTLVILGRKGHPLSKARSLADLGGARWISTSVTLDTSAELEPLFERYGLPKPIVDMSMASGVTGMPAVANSDLLIMVPEQWLSLTPAIQDMMAFQIAEPLPAPPICLVTRARLPLTPAAQHFADLFSRAGLHYVQARQEKEAERRSKSDAGK
jgi:LysR family transcriptional regulator of abg operon